MPPRANYECRSCEKTIPDLPIESTRCPICGKRRGFRRLYDTIRVSTKGRRIAKFIDGQMTPAMDAKSAREHSAKKFEGALKEVEGRIQEQATPEQRELIAQHQGPNGMRRMNIPAAAAFGAIDPVARHDSVHYTYPQIKRRVVPQWQR